MSTEADALRQMMAQLEAQGLSRLPPLSSSLVECTIDIALPSSPTKVKVIRPSSTGTAPRPLIVLFYGGGFKAGSIEQLTEPARTFAERFNAVVVLGQYRMIPDVRWPVPWKDAWELLVYLSSHANSPDFGHAELDGGNGGGFVVGGVSAGGSIATVCGEIDALGLAEREHVAPLDAKITGVMANVPFLVVPKIVPEHLKPHWTAWEDNVDATVFNTDSLKGVIEDIQCTDYTSCWFSPVCELTSSQQRLDSHPRVYISVCQMDPLRDDGLVYRDLLQRRGVDVKMDTFANDEHNGWTVMPMPRNSTDPSIEEAYLEGMKWLLGR